MTLTAPPDVATLADALDVRDVEVFARYGGYGDSPWLALGLDPYTWLAFTLGPPPELPSDPEPVEPSPTTLDDPEPRPSGPIEVARPATRDVATCATPTRGPTGRESAPGSQPGALTFRATSTRANRRKCHD